MSLQMSKLLEYEKKILENRRELQELTREQGLTDDEAMKNKLDYFQDELHYMESQLGFLKADLERRLSEQSVINVGMEPATAKVEFQPEENREMQMPQFVDGLSNEAELSTNNGLLNVVQNEAIGTSVTQQAQDSVRQQEPLQLQEWARPVRKQKNSEGLEKTIGKSIMGIAASVLIFISFILFATLLLPYFNDTAKMVTTYLVSGAFLGIGLWKLNKQKDNKFYLALTGCGFGALYISLLLSNMYFKVINDLVLFVLIAIWAMGVCAVSKLKNPIFQVIGQLGIFISLVFGAGLCADTGDIGKFGALVIFYIFTSTVFYVTHFQKEFSKNVLHHVFHTLSFITLLIGCDGVIGEKMHGITVLIFVFIVIHIAVCIYSSQEERNNGFGFFVGTYTFIAFVLSGFFGIETEVFNIIWYCISIVLLIVFLKKQKIGIADRNIGISILAILLILNAVANDFGSEHGLVPMIILPFLVLGYVGKNGILKYGSMFFFFLYVCNPVDSCWENLLLGIVVIATTFVLLYKFKEQYSPWMKYIIHILAVCFLPGSIDASVCEISSNTSLGEVWAYGVVVLFNVIMMKSCLSKNLKTGHTEKTVVYDLINLFYMMVGISMLRSDLGAWEHFVVILFTLLTFTVNAKNLLDRREHIGWGIYVGIKYTILLVCILDSFEAVNYVISITCFVFAILSIVIGFWKKYSSLRVFGLALSMISTFKLIMVDIYYSNTLGHALSFFGSGLLCFVISMIYNQVDKKMKEEEGVAQSEY